MPNYRRAFIPGGTWFFTVNLLQRHHNDLLIREIDLLRETVKRVREKHPFQIDAWVVLPEHLHSTAWMQKVGRKPLHAFSAFATSLWFSNAGAVAERMDFAARR